MNLKGGTQVWTWNRCYGRDGSPLPTELNENVMAMWAHNVELALDKLPSRRAGSASQGFSGGTAFNGFVKLARYFGHFGTADLTNDEYLFWSDQNGKIVWARMNALGTAPATVASSIADTFSSFGRDVVFCQFNEKMYVARQSNADRLHVIEGGSGSTVLRRVGLPRPAVPAVSNLGTGAYTGMRYYRIQYKSVYSPPLQPVQTLRQSNLGDPIGFNPSGTGSAVRIDVRDTSPPEAWTVWVVYASMDNLLYYNISGDISLFTASNFQDTIAPTDYPNYPSAPQEGSFNTWPSVRFLLAGVDRLIGFGVTGGADGGAVTDGRGGNVSTPGRVWFSPVLGTSNSDDDERVPVQLAGSNPLQNWIDVGRGLGATDAGLGGPIDGNILVFQDRGVYMLVPTGNVYAPFKRVTISTDVGAVEGSIFTGQDEVGRPAIYWLDPTAGPYRYGAGGLQWLGFDIRDIWATFNRLATQQVRAHGCFHNQTQTAFFWIATGTTNGATVCDTLLRFNARLGKDTGPTGVRFGWTTNDGIFAQASGSAIVRYSARGAGLQPNAVFQPIAATGATGAFMRDPTATTDAGYGYGAYARSKVINLSGAEFQVRQLITDWLYVQAVRADTSLNVFLIRNFADYGNLLATTAVTRTLNPPLQGVETNVLIRYEGLQIQDAWAIQTQIGDGTGAATAANWSVDYVTMAIEVRTQERWNPSA